ncbi:MAG: hypothetical protein IKA82_02130 [Clostridia bacterium]|nr:hypothetical protein [Clostridia bacterium]
MKRKILTALFAILALCSMLTVSMIGCKKDSDRTDKSPHETFAGYVDDSTPDSDTLPEYSEPSDSTLDDEPQDSAEPSVPTDTSEPTDPIQPPTSEPVESETNDSSVDTPEPPSDTETPSSDRNDVENILHASEQISTLFESIIEGAFPEVDMIRELLSVHEGQLAIDLNKFNILGADLLGGKTLNLSGVTKHDGTEYLIDGTLSSMQNSPRVLLILDRDGNLLLHFPDVDKNTYVNVLPESNLGNFVTLIKAYLAVFGSNTPASPTESPFDTFPYDIIPYLIGGLGDYISDKGIENETVVIERFGNTLKGVSKLTVSAGSEGSLVYYVKDSAVYGMEINSSYLSLEISILPAENTLYSVTLSATVGDSEPTTYTVSGRHFTDGTTLRGMIQLDAGDLISSVLQTIAKDAEVALAFSYNNTVAENGSAALEYNIGFLIDPDGMAFEITVPLTVTKTETEKGTSLTVTSKADLMGMISIDLSIRLDVEKRSKLEVYIEVPTAAQTVLNVQNPDDTAAISALIDSVKVSYPELADLIASFKSIDQMIPPLPKQK